MKGHAEILADGSTYEVSGPQRQCSGVVFNRIREYIDTEQIEKHVKKMHMQELRRYKPPNFPMAQSRTVDSSDLK